MKMELRTRITAAIEQTEIDTNEKEKYVYTFCTRI